MAENGLPADTRLFWVGLTIWGALFGTGTYVAIEHRLPGVLMALLGLVGLLSLVRDRIRKMTMKFNLLLGSSVVTWALLGYVIYDRYHPIGNHDLVVIALTASVAVVGIGLVLVGASQGSSKLEVYLGSARHWEARCGAKEEELKKAEAKIGRVDDQILTRLDTISNALAGGIEIVNLWNGDPVPLRFIVCGTALPSVPTIEVRVFAGGRWHKQWEVSRRGNKWQALCQFGSAESPDGSAYKLVAISPRVPLQNKIAELPSDALRSEIIEVVRSSAPKEAL